MNANERSPGYIARHHRERMAPVFFSRDGTFSRRSGRVDNFMVRENGYADEPLHRLDAPENQENDNDEENQT
jgi:hypothetical protein